MQNFGEEIVENCLLAVREEVEDHVRESTCEGGTLMGLLQR